MAAKKVPVSVWSEEWLSYYRSAAERARAIGDPLRRHLERGLARERLFLVASALVVGVVIGVFLHGAY